MNEIKLKGLKFSFSVEIEELQLNENNDYNDNQDLVEVAEKLKNGFDKVIESFNKLDDFNKNHNS